MYVIVKHHIERIGSLLLLFFFLTPSLCFSQNPTPLELRNIQTRKFEKPTRELVEGVKTFCEDIGARFVIVVPAVITTESLKNHPGLSGSVGELVPKGVKCTWMPDISPGFFGPKLNNKFSSLNLDVVKVAETGTVVRLRVYDAKNIQILDSAIYVDLFKSIADSLFVQAIELTPADQL